MKAFLPSDLTRLLRTAEVRIEPVFIEEEDAPVSPAGVKGVGELGLCGAAAAIAKAVFNATGKRVRSSGSSEAAWVAFDGTEAVIDGDLSELSDGTPVTVGPGPG